MKMKNRRKQFRFNVHTLSRVRGIYASPFSCIIRLVNIGLCRKIQQH